MNSSYFTAEIANQHNAKLIAEAKEYQLAKSFRRAARSRTGSKTNADDRVPDICETKMA